MRGFESEPNDPAVLVSAMPNWQPAEVLSPGQGNQLRILAIDTDIADELVQRRFNSRMLFLRSGYAAKD